MKFLKIIFLLFILLSSLAVKAVLAQSSASVTSSFSPSEAVALPNQDFTANIRLNPSAALKVRMYQLNVNFDPAKVQVKNIRYIVGTKSDILGGDGNENLAAINLSGQIRLIGELAVASPATLSPVATSFVELIFTSQSALQYNINTAGTSFLKNVKADLSLETISISPSSMIVNQAAPPTPPPPTPPPPTPPAAVSCSRFELSGLTKSSSKNPEGGPIYTAASSGSNNPLDLVFTPKNATATITAISQTTGAPDLTITETNTGTAVVRVANIPPNTSNTVDNTYLIRATVADAVSQISCLPIQVVVPKVGAEPGPPATTCPADISSTEVKFKNADNTGEWIKDRTITLGGSVRVGGFHNGQTPAASPLDIELSYVGPKGVTSPPAVNGAVFTPSSDPNVGPGAYVFTATTIGKTGAKCIGTATLVVTAVPTPPPTPAPVKKTLCFAIGEGPEGKSAVEAVKDCSNIDKKLVFPYDSEPFKISGFPFKDQTPGIKTIFVKFIGLLGSSPVTKPEQLSIRFTPNPAIANVLCTHSSSGVGTDIKITGSNFGAQGKGKVKVGNQDITPDSWDSATNTITGRLEQRLEGKIPVEVTADDGRVAKGECVVNTTTIAFKTLMACKSAGSFQASNVDVKVFEALPLLTGAQVPEPILKQKISLNKDGEPQNFAPKFEKKKKYQLIIKVPGTLARRVDFDTKDGGTTNLEGAISLPQGDIAPSNSPDGKINALDKSELIRQWNIVSDVAKSADLNGDSRVNSIDYACMRQNFNASDETYSAPTPPPSPSGASPGPTATPSASVSTVLLDSITPSSGIFGQLIILRGSGFGSQTGGVAFYGSLGQLSGGAVIVSWSDTQINATVPAVASGTFRVEVSNAQNQKSGRVDFQVTAGQPYISSITPLAAGAGEQITFSGSEFGTNTGAVNVYQPGSLTVFSACAISSWTDSSIVCTLPSNLSVNTDYYLGVVTSDNRNSSLKVYTVGSPSPSPSPSPSGVSI